MTPSEQLQTVDTKRLYAAAFDLFWPTAWKKRKKRRKEIINVLCQCTKCGELGMLGRNVQKSQEKIKKHKVWVTSLPNIQDQ